MKAEFCGEERTGSCRRELQTVGCSNGCDASTSKQLRKSHVFSIGSSVGVRERKCWSVNIQKPEEDFDFLFLSVLLPWDRGSYWAQSQRLLEASNLSGAVCLCLPKLEPWTCGSMPGFLHGSGNSNSDSLAHTAGALTHGHHPRLIAYVFFCLFKLTALTASC